MTTSELLRKKCSEVLSLLDLENLFKKDRIEEKDGWEDYFRLDHLEAEIESIRKALSVL